MEIKSRMAVNGIGSSPGPYGVFHVSDLVPSPPTTVSSHSVSPTQTPVASPRKNTSTSTSTTTTPTNLSPRYQQVAVVPKQQFVPKQNCQYYTYAQSPAVSPPGPWANNYHGSSPAHLSPPASSVWSAPPASLPMFVPPSYPTNTNTNSTPNAMNINNTNSSNNWNNIQEINKDLRHDFMVQTTTTLTTISTRQDEGRSPQRQRQQAVPSKQLPVCAQNPVQEQKFFEDSLCDNMNSIDLHRGHYNAFDPSLSISIPCKIEDDDWVGGYQRDIGFGFNEDIPGQASFLLPKMEDFDYEGF